MIDVIPQYIDDTSILNSAKTLISLESQMGSCLDYLAGWAHDNDLMINHSKTKFLIFFKKNSKRNIEIERK